MPLLACLLVEADKQGLRVTGSDLDVTTAVTVPCTVKAVGKVAVSARHFNEVVRKIPRGLLQLSDRRRAVRGSLRRRQGLVALPDPGRVRLPAHARAQGRDPGELWPVTRWRVSSPARSTPPRPTPRVRTCTGCFIQGGDKQLTVVATDGHRLARASRKGGFGEPRQGRGDRTDRALAAVSRAAEEATSPVLDRDRARRRTRRGSPRRWASSRCRSWRGCSQGPYPNYEQVIPKGNPRELRISASELLEAVDIVASHADNVTRAGALLGRAGPPGRLLGHRARRRRARSAPSSRATELEIGYNADYLIDILRSIRQRARAVPAQQRSDGGRGRAGGRAQAGRGRPAVPGHAAPASRRGGLRHESIARVLPALLRELGLEAGVLGLACGRGMVRTRWVLRSRAARAP